VFHYTSCIEVFRRSIIEAIRDVGAKSSFNIFGLTNIIRGAITTFYNIYCIVSGTIRKTENWQEKFVQSQEGSVIGESTYLTPLIITFYEKIVFITDDRRGMN
jgi:hypothetical protein